MIVNGTTEKVLGCIMLRAVAVGASETPNASMSDQESTPFPSLIRAPGVFEEGKVKERLPESVGARMVSVFVGSFAALGSTNFSAFELAHVCAHPGGHKTTEFITKKTIAAAIPAIGERVPSVDLWGKSIVSDSKLLNEPSHSPPEQNSGL